MNAKSIALVALFASVSSTVMPACSSQAAQPLRTSDATTPPPTSSPQPSTEQIDGGIEPIPANAAGRLPRSSPTPFELSDLQACSSIAFSLYFFDRHSEGILLNPATKEEIRLPNGFLPVSFSPSREDLLLASGGDLYLADYLGNNPVLLYANEEFDAGIGTRWLDDDRLVMELNRGGFATRGISLLDLSSGNPLVSISDDYWRILAVSPGGDAWIEGFIDYGIEPQRRTNLVFPDGSKIPLWPDFLVLYFDNASSLYQTQIDYMPDGSGVIFAGYELPRESDAVEGIYFAEIEDGRPSSPPVEIYSVPKGSFLVALSISPNAEHLAILVGGAKDFIAVVNLATLQTSDRVVPPLHPDSALVWSPDSRYLAMQSRTAGYVDHLIVIDPLTGARSTLYTAEDVFVNAIQWSDRCTRAP